MSLKQYIGKLVMVLLHTCKLQLSGGGDKRITSSRPAWVKLVRPHLKNKINWGALLQACNPNYLSGRDWEDLGLRLAWEKSLRETLTTNKS
jgi:hypothetical protein